MNGKSDLSKKKKVYEQEVSFFLDSQRILKAENGLIYLFLSLVQTNAT